MVLRDNRKHNKAEEDANLRDILADDTPIPEDIDPSDHEDTPKEEPTKEVIVEEEPEDPKEEVDYKEKYSASSREATALHFKNQKLTNTIEEASNLPEPSVEELRQYAILQSADYDDLDNFSQKILKKTLMNEKRFKMIHETSVVNKKLDTWAKSVDGFLNSPETLVKFPSMADTENSVAFKKYCMKEQRRGMDMEDLTASFLFNIQRDTPAPKKTKKKALLLKGGGGGDAVPKPKKLTAEDMRVIRTKDPRRYKRLVKEGKAGLDLLDRE